ncbi:SMCR8 protein, partial [Polyodon spathula]|nr:SMCR8 protein [Polyodon spathula]
MISSPDLVAFTEEDYFGDTYVEPNSLPEEFWLPLFPYAGNANPWSKASFAKFTKDFILISEFSEQVGPQPLLTIPDDPKAWGTFDLNYFSLRIMSVDYQTSFVGHPPGCGYPKLNFVEDSRVVLGDSKEGAFAYVHHLTLYDLEARGFVRPFCIAYISADEDKIMQQFQELSSEFTKASECLKTGNRKAFASELERKLKDLEYTRTVLHEEAELQKKENGCYATQSIEKANELANVEKSIYEHKDLLKQVTSYPNRKLKDPDFLPYEPEPLGVDQDQISGDSNPEDPLDDPSSARRPSYTPQFIKAKSTKCFDKRLKTLEELSDVYFFNQTMDQLAQIEKTFRGDLCYISTSQIDTALLKQQKITNFLFEVFRDWEEESEKPHEEGQQETESSLCDITQDNSEECLEADMKDSVSSGESIEVLGSERSFPAQGSFIQSESQASLPVHYPEVVRRKEVSKRTNSEDSIEVLSTTDSITPEDLRASCPTSIYEEGPYGDSSEKHIYQSPALSQQQVDSGVKDAGGVEKEATEQADPACCIGQEGPRFEEPAPELGQECSNSGLVKVAPRLDVDDFSDSTSFMSASTSSERAASPFLSGNPITVKHKRKAGQGALRFIREYPLAQQAIFCLLSGRTLVVMGADEEKVRKLVSALIIFVPNLGKYAETVKPWLTSPFQITDLHSWKLIGLHSVLSTVVNRLLTVGSNRGVASPTGSSMLKLADHWTQIKCGSTYFMHVQSMLSQLCSKAFLYTFCHHLHLPIHPGEGDASVASRRMGFLQHQLGVSGEDFKIVQFLGELIKLHYLQGPGKGGTPPVFRFDYTTSFLYKI